MIPNRWTIRWKLTVWNSAVLTLLFCVFCIAILLTVHGHLSNQADRIMKEELNELLEDFRSTDDTSAMIAHLERRFAVHADYHFQVMNSDGESLFRSRYLSNVKLPFPSDPAQLRGHVYEDVDLPEGQFRLLSISIRNSHSEPMLLQVITPRSAMQKEFSWYMGTLLTSLPIAIIVSIGAGHLLARQALQPLERITDTARRISAESLNERIAVDHPNDELGHLTTTLNAMFDRLQVSIAQMKQFTSDAAHELRSPIAALKTRVQVALRTHRSHDDLLRVTRDTLVEANHMSELVDQLLLLSRHDSGQEPAQFDDVRVDVVLLDVAERFRPLAEGRGQQLIVTSLPNWLMQGDDVWLSLLFWNLIDNASKYTEWGGQIWLFARVENGCWRCSIRDTGHGIEEQHLDRLFDRFYRIDASRTRPSGGTGLGLAICKSIAEIHRGTISVTSKYGVGSDFQVVLPGRLVDPDMDIPEEPVLVKQRGKS